MTERRGSRSIPGKLDRFSLDSALSFLAPTFPSFPILPASTVWRPRSGYDENEEPCGMGVIRELPADQIEQLLSSAIVGRIACSHPDEARPYLVPFAYGYDGIAIYAHSGPGKKLDYMRANPLVTVEVD